MTAAIVTVLHTVRCMLTDNDFVHVYSFDFSKAFDTVQHVTLTSNLAQLELPDNIYNWTVDSLDNHAHCTKYAGQVSAVAVIQASIIQGSAIGPAFYVVTAADLHPVFKFADDTYLVVPGVNTDTSREEIDHIQTWAADNLKLNRNKTKEIVFSSRREGALALPPPRPDIERVTSLRVLSVIVHDKLTAADHMTMLLSSCSSLLYAMRVLRSHGTPTTSLHDIFRAIVQSINQSIVDLYSAYTQSL